MNTLYLEYNVSSASLVNHLCNERLEMAERLLNVPAAYRLLIVALAILIYTLITSRRAA